MSSSSNPAPGNSNTTISPSQGTENISPATHHSVKVSLRVNVDCSGTVDIFTAGGVTLNNVVPVSVQLDASALYVDSTHAAFEFWEPLGAPGDISGCVMGQSGSETKFTASNGVAASAMFSDSLADMAYRLNLGLWRCLSNYPASPLDVTVVPPFNTLPSAYQSYTSFGALGLATYASYLFGHPQATAAIDNDVDIQQSLDDSRLAASLVTAISQINAVTATAIVDQVISQDPSRARGQDNSQLTPDTHQGLLFAAGDVIYVSVTLKAPTITNGAGAANPVGDTPASSVAGSNLIGDAFPSNGVQFTMQITLK